MCIPVACHLDAEYILMAFDFERQISASRHFDKLIYTKARSCHVSNSKLLLQFAASCPISTQKIITIFQEARNIYISRSKWQKNDTSIYDLKAKPNKLPVKV